MNEETREKIKSLKEEKRLLSEFRVSKEMIREFRERFGTDFDLEYPDLAQEVKKQATLELRKRNALRKEIAKLEGS